MNYFRLMGKVWRATMEAKRYLTLDEFIAHEEKKLAKEEQNFFYKTIALLSICWAQIEVVLDYSNLFIITAFDTSETQLPISLKPKIAFFKKHFKEIPELEEYRERALKLVERINNLKETRHDIIHGVAVKEVTKGIRQFIRHDYKGKSLIQMPKNYTLDQMTVKVEEIADLTGDLVEFLLEILRSGKFENVTGQLTVGFPTIGLPKS
ncbi:hypothetical protein [Afipia sp. DC4300-2b1]|uniref:hypothetical protein n=1 Tax=Afipia sp. DC4300-2b1 TaxID=2804672 RepID=UPI003CF74493